MSGMFRIIKSVICRAELLNLFIHCFIIFLVPSFLSKEWKPKYCVLYKDGEFSIYQNATDATAEIRINLRTEVRSIEAGHDVSTSIKLPNNRNDFDSLFGVFGNEKKPHYFLASGQSECR